MSAARSSRVISASILLCLAWGLGCAGRAAPLPSGEAQSQAQGEAAPQGLGERGLAAASAEPSAPPRRLLVLRLGGEHPEVIRSRALPPAAPRVARPGPQGRDGRYEVLDRAGRRLALGFFRIPRRVHALFGEVEGPAGPGSAPIARPLVMLRVETPAGAARVVLWDRARGRGLGEVIL